MRRLWPLCSVLLLTGCLKFHTGSDYNPGSNYSPYKTYYLERDPHLTRSDPETDTNVLVADRIQATVKEILGGKGITPAPKASAAMWIYWSYSIERTPDAPDRPADSIRTVEESIGHAPAGRVLIIFEMINAKTEKSLWRGTAESELYPDISSRMQAKRVREAVRSTFKPFPPKD